MFNLICMADKKTHTVGARVDEKTYNLLESLAKRDERTVSWLIGKIIQEWIERKEADKTPDVKKTSNEG